jgi:putative spermidine/putrescine transport system permease protein
MTHGRPAAFTIALWAATAAVVAFLVAPIAVVVIASFNDAAILSFPLQRFSVRWYVAFFHDFELLQALQVSLVVATIATALAILVGVPAAFSLARFDFSGREAVGAFLLSPLLIPLIVLGLAVLLVYAAVGLRATLTGFVVMHVLITTPYVVRTVLAVLARLDTALEEAALSLGADDLRTTWHVTLPLIKPGIFAGGFFAFMTSFDNVPLSIFLGSSKLVTLPVKVYSQVEAYGIDPVFAAISTLVIAGTLAVMLLFDRFVGLDYLR